MEVMILSADSPKETRSQKIASVLGAPPVGVKRQKKEKGFVVGARASFAVVTWPKDFIIM